MRWLLILALAVPLAVGAQPEPETIPGKKAPPRRGTIDVVLVSDGQTWVSVEGEGQYVPFQFKGEKRIKLPPGYHDVVGRRTGYRDVRSTLKMAPDMPTPRVVVICTESR